MPARPPGNPRREEWLGVHERGSPALLRLMAASSLHLGRRASRAVLHAVTAYYFAVAPRARRASRGYLRRALGREPRLHERYRHFLHFATTIHDRVFLAGDREDSLALSIEGAALMRAQQASGRGAILLGAHFGSFAIVGAVGRRIDGVHIAMAMYEDNARKLRRLFEAIGAQSAPPIVPLGQVDSMLRIAERLDRGEFVGILGDRSLGGDARRPVRLLGERVLLPTGPMRIAAMLGCPVIFMAGLYRGANRYHIVFEPLADFAGLHGADRRAAVDAAIERYAALLDAHCRRDPYNWFNFYEFWDLADPEAR